MKSFLNLIRLALLFIFLLPLYFFLKERAVFLFLKFSGPSFIKLGQALAARPDLIGEKLAKTLAHFQDKLNPFSAKKVKKILTKEFGKNFHQKFVEFNFCAHASASIAQVHKARLFSGEEVAIKILRPNIKKTFLRDVKTLAMIAKIVTIFSKFLGKTLKDLTQLLIEASKSELNLLKEAANAMRLKEELLLVEGFYVPQIFTRYSTKNVLVIEWIDGVPFSDFEAIKATNFNKELLAKNLVISYFTQVYSNGFFHADMHQGNLFLMKNGNIAVVDFGIMGKINKKTRIAVAEILIGFLNKDYKKVAQTHIKAGFVPEDTDIFELALSCQKIGDEIVGSSVQNISLVMLLKNIIDMTKSYEMTTRSELLLLQKTLLLVEGVGVMLHEDLNIWHLANPWMREWAKRNLGLDAKIKDFLSNIISEISILRSR